jgi:hypothetical protein
MAPCPDITVVAETRKNAFSVMLKAVGYTPNARLKYPGYHHLPSSSLH